MQKFRLIPKKNRTTSPIQQAHAFEGLNAVRYPIEIKPNSFKSMKFGDKKSNLKTIGYHATHARIGQGFPRSRYFATRLAFVRHTLNKSMEMRRNWKREVTKPAQRRIIRDIMQSGMEGQLRELAKIKSPAEVEARRQALTSQIEQDFPLIDLKELKKQVPKRVLAENLMTKTEEAIDGLYGKATPQFEKNLVESVAKLEERNRKQPSPTIQKRLDEIKARIEDVREIMALAKK